MTENIYDLERWEGDGPGEHQYSTLEGLRELKAGELPGNDQLDLFFRAAEKLVTQWQGNRFAGLYLYGTPGTGKTHAAIGLGRALHDAGAEVHYRYVPSIETMTSSAVRNWSDARSYGSLCSNSASSVFPSKHTPGIERNPKSVLILDDYQPKWQRPVAAAVEAGVQFGGLVVVTSNYPDPFTFVETPLDVKAPEAIVAEDMARHIDPEQAAAAEQARQTRQQEFSASFRSRVAAGFRFIEFSGTDHRMGNGFFEDL